jgi:hypothetical protein
MHEGKPRSVPDLLGSTGDLLAGGDGGGEQRLIRAHLGVVVADIQPDSMSGGGEPVQPVENRPSVRPHRGQDP